MGSSEAVPGVCCRPGMAVSTARRPLRPFTGCHGGSVFRMSERGDVTVVLTTSANGGVEDPLVENTDARVYGSYLYGSFFAIAPDGVVTTIPTPPGYARIETRASDGKFYGPRNQYPNNRFSSLTANGVLASITVTGAPAPDSFNRRIPPHRRRVGYPYGSGQANSAIDWVSSTACRSLGRVVPPMSASFLRLSSENGSAALLAR